MRLHMTMRVVMVMILIFFSFCNCIPDPPQGGGGGAGAPPGHGTARRPHEDHGRPARSHSRALRARLWITGGRPHRPRPLVSPPARSLIMWHHWHRPGTHPVATMGVNKCHTL